MALPGIRQQLQLQSTITNTSNGLHPAHDTSGSVSLFFASTSNFWVLLLSMQLCCVLYIINTNLKSKENRKHDNI
jgi:hypothetical protein